MTRTLKQLAAAAAAGAALSASAGPYTDLWWNPQESGWGVNVVQQLETAFVTLFVYGPDGKPTWLVASDARITAYSGSGGLPVFSGTLFRTEGASHAGPWDPSKSRTVPVGELQLEVLAKDRMRVHYTADGATVVREVVRQTWQEPGLVGTYASKFVLRQSVPGSPPYATRDYEADVMVHFEGGTAYFRVDESNGRRCEYRGPYQQTGKLAKVAGTFSCNLLAPNVGTFEITDLEVTDNGFTGYLRTYAETRNEYGRFGAARY